MKIDWSFEVFHNDSGGYHTETCLCELPQRIVDSITQMLTAGHTDHDGVVYQKYIYGIRVLTNKMRTVWHTEVFLSEIEKELPWLELSASSAEALAEKYDYLKNQIISAKL